MGSALLRRRVGSGGQDSSPCLWQCWTGCIFADTVEVFSRLCHTGLCLLQMWAGMHDGVWEALGVLCSQRGGAWRCCFKVLEGALLARDFSLVEESLDCPCSQGSWWRKDDAWAAKVEEGKNKATCGIEHVQCVARAH